MLTVGVPEMVPLLRLNPEGRPGDIPQLSITPPPLFEKVMSVITPPRVSTESVCEVEMLGLGSLTVMLIVTESEPPELLAQTV
jgi:hypothetical protein